MTDYIINSYQKIVGEIKDYDSHSRKGMLKIYNIGDGEDYKHGELDKDFNVLSEQDIKKDEDLHSALMESNYQNWRFQKRNMLQSDYERVRKHLVNYDHFCRRYYIAMNTGTLAEYLTKEFAECTLYFESAFYIDSHREPVKHQDGD